MRSVHKKLALAVLMAGFFAANPASAQKPEWKDHGPDRGAQDMRRDNPRDQGRDEARFRGDDRREEREHRADWRDDRRADRRGGVQIYFNDQHRSYVRDYYRDSFRGGHCPPGLAKKHNGCLPPGQAKKWRKGYPLPRGVVYYDVPYDVVVHLGHPPAGHKFVRVASDILLIAIGSGMVIDAINDIGGM